MAKLYFKYGVMGSAKSAEALITANRYNNCEKTALLLTSALDDRYKIGEIKSRAIKDSMIAIPIGKNNNIINILTSYIAKANITPDIIIVDECQFFTKSQIEQLFFITKMRNIPVIAYGLRTDFKGDLFEGSKWLLAWADDICEIPTICKCGKKARMVLRKVDGNVVFSGEQILIGDIEYESVCSDCFIREKNIFNVGDTVIILPESENFQQNYKENIGIITEILGDFPSDNNENNRCKLYRVKNNEGVIYLRTNKSLYKTNTHLNVNDTIIVINIMSNYFGLQGKIISKYENGVIADFDGAEIPLKYEDIKLNK